MAIGFRRTVIALLFLSIAFLGCAGQAKVTGGGTIIGNPKFPTAPVGPRQKTPGDEQEKHPEKAPSKQSDEEQPQPCSEVQMHLGGMRLSVVLKPSKWILGPPGIPQRERIDVFSRETLRGTGRFDLFEQDQKKSLNEWLFTAGADSKPQPFKR